MIDEDGGGPHRKGKVQAIPKAVGKKQKGPKDPVLLGHIQYAFGIGLGAIDHMAVMVYSAHEHLRISAAVKPKGDVIGCGVCCVTLGLRLFHERVKTEIPMVLPSSHHDKVLQEFCPTANLFDLGKKDRINDQHPGPSVIEHIKKVLGFHQDVCWYGNGSQPDGAKKREDHLG